MRSVSVFLSLAFGLAVALLVTGQSSCYSPAIDDCQYSCNGESCPAGMFCNVERRCVSDSEFRCGAQMDGGTKDTIEMDTAMPGDGSGSGSGSGDAGGPSDGFMPPPPLDSAP